jgi:hypothetical protein
LELGKGLAVCGTSIVQLCSDKETAPMNVKKIISILLLVGGIAVLILSATADLIGIGENPSFGHVQIAGVTAGAVAAVIGLALLRRKQKQ